jgi:hypothetical protein
MIADLGKAKRSVFSLSAPPIPVNEIVLAPNLVIPADMIINGSIVATTVMPKPSVPQPVVDEDDELAAIAELDDDTKPPPPRTAAAMIAAEPEPVNDPLKPPPPGKWRKPTGRLVGTKEPVWVETDAPKKEKEEETEKPDHTGFIQEAGFLEAE